MVKISPFQLLMSLETKDKRFLKRLRRTDANPKKTEMHELSDEDFKEVNIHVSMSNYKHA
jgi:hypothetical protein